MSIPYKSNIGIGYGMYEKLPELPDMNHEWIMEPGDFLFLRDVRKGRIYYVDFPVGKNIADCAFAELILGERKTATLWDWIRTRGKLRVGSFYRATPK